MRRKTLSNNLKGCGGFAEAMERAGIDGSLRAEALSPSELLSLYREIRGA